MTDKFVEGIGNVIIGPPPADSEDKRADMALRGEQVLRRIGATVYGCWDSLRVGSDAFFGTVHNYATKESIVNTSVHLEVGMNTGFRDRNDAPYQEAMNRTCDEVVGGTKEPMKTLQEGSNIKTVQGPAEQFDDEVKAIYQQMIEAASKGENDEAKVMADKIKDRIKSEEDTFGTRMASLLGAVEKVTEVVKKSKDEFTDWRYSDKRGEGGEPDVRSFAVSLDQLRDATDRNSETLKTHCRSVGRDTEDLDKPWRNFVREFFSSQSPQGE